MLERMSGSIFDSDAQALVCPVNCAGAMGKGLALEFKQRYPRMYAEYRDECKRGLIRLGEVWYYPIGRRYIICLPTKGHWREKSKIENVQGGLRALRLSLARATEIHSVAVPALGCGEGGLDWEVVRPMILEELSGLDINLNLYPPAVVS